MKKIFVAIAMFMVMSFASCGNSTNSAASANDTDTVVVDTDTVVVDSVDSVVVDSATVAE